MAQEREVDKWITINGKHIPVYKKSYAKFGEPGTYLVYRSGKTSFKDDNYPVFFTPDESYANEYRNDKNFDRREFGEYEVSITNPLVIDVKATESHTWDENSETYYYHDEQAGPITAYNQLFGTDYDFTTNDGVDRYLGWETAKTKRVKMQQQRDQEMMNEALNQGYDAIMYRFDKPMTGLHGVKWSDGRTKSKNEIMIPASKAKEAELLRKKDKMKYTANGYIEWPSKKKGN